MGMSHSFSAHSCHYRPKWWRENLAQMIFLLVVACAWLPSFARAEQVAEYDLKAAFLYNFAQFTEWPAGGDNFLRICDYGRNPFGAALDVLGGKAVRERRVKVAHATTPEEARQCDVLFVGDLERERLTALLSTLRDKSVLTVGEGENAMPQGVSIRLLIENNRMSFEVNLDSIKKSRLVISSKLLRLARAVHGAVSP